MHVRFIKGALLKMTDVKTVNCFINKIKKCKGQGS